MVQYNQGESNQGEIVSLMANGARLPNIHDEALNKGQMKGSDVN